MWIELLLVAHLLKILAVAKIVAYEIGMDATSIAAALLHDVVEDSDDYNINDIQQMFGETVARISKLSWILYEPKFGHFLQTSREIGLNYEAIIAIESDISCRSILQNFRHKNSMVWMKKISINFGHKLDGSAEIWTF